MVEDAAARGLGARDIAQLADPKLHIKTVYRFLSGKVQTPQTAEALAKGLGFPVERYIVRAEPAPGEADRRAGVDRRSVPEAGRRGVGGAE